MIAKRGPRQATFDVEREVERRRLLLGIHAYLGLGLAVSGAVGQFAIANGIYGSFQDSPLLFWSLVLSPLGLSALAEPFIKKFNDTAAQAALWVYASLVGFSLASVFLVLASTNIVRAFFTTAAAFLCMSVHGHLTRDDCDGLGAFIGMGTAGIVIVSIVGMVAASTPLQLAVSLAMLLIFVAVFAHEAPRIMPAYTRARGKKSRPEWPAAGALTVYVRIFNPLGILRHFIRISDG